MDETNWTKTLEYFYLDCHRYWLRQGKEGKEAKRLALKDVLACKTNPYKPQGEPVPSEYLKPYRKSLKALEK